MTKRLRLCLLLLLLLTAGCNRGTKAPVRAPEEYRAVLSVTDVTSRLTEMNLTTRIASAVTHGPTPFGKADTVKLVVEGEEFFPVIFGSTDEADKGLSWGLSYGSWPHPSAIIRWKNVVISVPRSNLPIGKNVVNALSPLADQVVSR